jgi:nucleoside 2-deoxyribosyltransferase
VNIYLAGELGASHYIENTVAPALERAGHTITKKWWNEDWEPVTYRAHSVVALQRESSVRRAYALVLVPPNDGGTGCFIEFGIALALGIPVYVLHPDGPERKHRHSSFFHHPDVTILNHVNGLLKAANGE